MSKIKLADLSTRAPDDADKDDIKAKLPKLYEELDDLQNLLYANSSHSVLVIIQGLDAAGKDGMIKDVFSAINPQGVRVYSYKVPTAIEFAHDFLWRLHANVPPKGMIHVFNRSQYEDILVPVVHGTITKDEAKDRMEAINHFEELLTKFGNTKILKVYLHASEKEQMERQQERVTIQKKMWKYNPNDLIEMQKRDQYLETYEMIFDKCDKEPWHIIPADQNWYKAWALANLLKELISGLDMKYPTLSM